MSALATATRALRRLRDDVGGLALLEFAFVLPIFLVMSLTGAELTNYIITRMRVSQMALHLADNAARIGNGSQLQAKTITETDINDLFVGTGLQSGELDLYNHGRVIITSLVPMANPNTTGKYKIGWQRCKGVRTAHASTYGTVGTSSGTSMDGMGPTGRQITAPDDSGTMFVEVYYEYTPLVKTSLSPSSTMTEIASMMIRDRRDMTAIYNTNGATISSC